jgi:hypothetical protein
MHRNSGRSYRGFFAQIFYLFPYANIALTPAK